MARRGVRLSSRDTERLAKDATRIGRRIDRAVHGRRRPDAAARRTRAVIILVVFVALLTVAALDRWGAFSPGAAEVSAYNGATTIVERVIDGDTIVVALLDPRTGRPMRVRLWGIDAPEAAMRDAPAEPFADEATDLLRRLAEGQEAVLLLEPSRARDRYERLLAHVIVDGESVGAALVRDGLAESVEQWRHRETARFEALERDARRAHRGIWSEPVR